MSKSFKAFVIAMLFGISASNTDIDAIVIMANVVGVVYMSVAAYFIFKGEGLLDD